VVPGPRTISGACRALVRNAGRTRRRPVLGCPVPGCPVPGCGAISVG
jgi:hypothetical protein